MKAIVQDRYGSSAVLEVRDVDNPVPKDNEVLIRVHASSVNAADWHFMTGLPLIARLVMGPRKPKSKILGRDLAGRVEAVGKDVTRFQVGDDVFGEAEHGCFAEYVCVPEDLLGPKPASLTFEQAAALPLAAGTALQGLRDKAKVQPGEKVLIKGASGGVGTYAVQIGVALGAEVIGICSTRNVELVRSLGADHVIDYTNEDFTQNGERYDVILDIAGRHSLSDCRRALAPKGRLVMTNGEGSRFFGPIGRNLRASVMSLFVGQKMGAYLAKPSKENLAELTELVAAGKIIPSIESTYPLSDAREAVRHFEEDHAQAKIVITTQ